MIIPPRTSSLFSHRVGQSRAPWREPPTSKRETLTKPARERLDFKRAEGFHPCGRRQMQPRLTERSNLRSLRRVQPRSISRKLALLVAEREIEMYSRGGGIGIVGVIIIVLVILWLIHVI